MRDVLKCIADAMEGAGLAYAFERWADDPPRTYFVGEYVEAAPQTEDGMREVSVTISGWTRGTWEELEQARAKIEAAFPAVEGRSFPGTGATAFYAGCTPVPVEDADIKRVQITIDVKQWRF